MGGARATTKTMKSRRKNRAKPESERAKRKGGLGEMNFCPPALSAEGGLGVGSGSSLRQQGSKARKNCFLN